MFEWGGTDSTQGKPEKNHPNEQQAEKHQEGKASRRRSAKKWKV